MKGINMSTLTTARRTAPSVIRQAAGLICERGWGTLGGRAPADVNTGSCGLSLCAAVCWAVRGAPCRPRDLSDIESEHVAETLDHLEACWREPVAAFERRTADESAARVSHDLRLVALNLEGELDILRD